MRELSFERPLEADPTRLLPRLEQVLRGLGYAANTRSSHEFNFLGQSNAGPHRLQVKSDGRAVRFTFAPGAPGITLPDEQVLSALVDGAIGALGETRAASRPAPPPPNVGSRRCHICASPLEAGVTVCPLCGMSND